MDDEGGPGPTVRRTPVFWWRVAIVAAGVFAMSFDNLSLIYFTTQSNLIVFGYYGCSVYRMATTGSTDPAVPRLRGAVTLWILITGLVAHFMLGDGGSPLPGLVSGTDLFAEWTQFTLHYVVPLMVLVDFVVFGPRQASSWWDLPLWLAFPAAYAFIVEVRAAVYPDFVVPYPYFFLDPTVNGYGWLTGQLLMYGAGFLILGAALLSVDRLPLRRPARPA